MTEKRKNRINLNEIPKQNNFSVPNGYFDSFEQRLMEKIKGEDYGKVIPLNTNRWSVFRSQVSLVASFIVFVVLSYMAINFILNKHSNENIEYAELLEYEMTNLDETYLMETYSAEQAEISTDDENIDYTEAVIEYLASDNIDLNLIIENL
jgi:hypothetical protein